MYFFPTQPKPHVLNDSYELLLSQERHFDRITKEFKIIDKTHNILDLKKIEAALFSMEIVLKKEMDTLKSKCENLENLSSGKVEN